MAIDFHILSFMVVTERFPFPFPFVTLTLIPAKKRCEHLGLVRKTCVIYVVALKLLSFSVESIFGLISYSYLVLDIDLAHSSRRSIAPKKI